MNECSDVLKDVLENNMKIVFCGSAVGKVSAEKQAYYAGPGNKFWVTLNDVCLTDELIEPKDYLKLKEKYHMGFTDILKKQSGNDNQVDFKDYSKIDFEENILKYSPLILAFTSKKSASIYFEKRTREIEYGLQKEKIGETYLFVLPSPSGAAVKWFNKKYWKELKKESDKLTGSI